MTDAGKERRELCPHLPFRDRDPEPRPSPLASHLGRKDEVLVPQGLEALPLFFSSREERALEEQEEVIEEHPPGKRSSITASNDGCRKEQPRVGVNSR